MCVAFCCLSWDLTVYLSSTWIKHTFICSLPLLYINHSQSWGRDLILFVSFMATMASSQEWNIADMCFLLSSSWFVLIVRRLMREKSVSYTVSNSHSDDGFILVNIVGHILEDRSCIVGATSWFSLGPPEGDYAVLTRPAELSWFKQSRRFPLY